MENKVRFFVKDFFDVYNIDHINAYRNLEKTGTWPVGFVPDDVEFEVLWHYLIQVKIAREWIKKFEELIQGK